MMQRKGRSVVPSNAYILVHDPVIGRNVIHLVNGERLTLGRAPTNTIVIHDERASRFHAEIFPAPAGWAVRDLESRNGTLLDEQPLEGDHLLASGDTISIGRTEIVFRQGDPPSDPGRGELGGTSTNEIPAEAVHWQASITHRRAQSRLLENIRETSEIVPRMGQAVAELCRLSFALGRAADVQAMALLALESAVQGAGAARGIAILPGSGPARLADKAERIAVESLATAAIFPASSPTATLPVGMIATVLGTNEAVLSCASQPGAQHIACISAPVRAGGRPVGVIHLEVEAAEREATPDDLEFVMAACDALGVAVENLSAREALSTRLASTADENERLKRRLGEESQMVGASAVLVAIKDQIALVAGTKATVLVRGESGSGKELVARAIHESSDRSRSPFVCLNCAALSETLLESELFGHEKGAFTGATERKAGKFEAAHKGTLMLDEIGEMSPAIQAKFLRVLEGHPFERVGGSNRVQVDVRVVAATNRNLEEAVSSGEFRRDLYFRLKVVEILVPPLRKRPADIEPLARHFLNRFALETGRKVRDFTPQALDALLSYHWPGNIRELRNCIERAVVLSLDEAVDVHELALSHLSSPGETGKRAGDKPGPFVPETLDDMERRHVMATLEAVGGNKTKAAAILGIERSTLDRKLARWAKA
jgi:transcriptional regulator with GAF, ATPase, and Fis domain